MSKCEISSKDMRESFFDEIYKLALTNRDIFIISNDFGSQSLDLFRKDLPGQFINAAIAEQNMISVAAGLAMSGKRVIAYSIASFLTLRCYEQIKIDICVMKLPVILLGVGPCYGYSADGPTHHATEDVSVMRALSGMKIYSPSDSVAAGELAKHVIDTDSACYIRLDRGKQPVVFKSASDFEKGYTVHGRGKDACIITTGILTHQALQAVKLLKVKNVSASVVELNRLKPIDGSLAKELKKYKLLATVEEHTIHGGLGGIIAEYAIDNQIASPIIRRAIPDDKLYAYGIRKTMHEQLGLTSEKISEMVVSHFACKK